MADAAVSRLLDSVAVNRFRDLIHQRTGISHPEARVEELPHSITRAAAELRLRDPAELYELLAQHDGRSDALDALLAALNVSETYFFRDSRQLEIVEQRILPELIERRASQRQLRLWSAGCSTGEEAYTLAIIVRRLLGNSTPWDVTILATDINERSLESARRGMYRPWSLRGCTPIDVAPYLIRDGSDFRVTPSIRAMVRFATLNLAQPVYPSLTTGTDALDLVLCRNVVMYFSENARRAALERLAATLAPGGFLLTSQVEAGFPEPAGLVLDQPGDAVYRKPTQTARTTEAEQARRPRMRTRPARPAIREARRRRAPLTPDPTPEINPATRGFGMAISEGDSDAIGRHCREALARWREGLVDEATEQLSQAAEGHPLSAPLHYLHGLTLLDTGRSAEALTALRRCTYADPSSAPAHLALACACSRLGMRGRARAALATASRLAAELSPEDRIDAHGLGELTVAEILELIAAQQQLLLTEDIRTPSFAVAGKRIGQGGFHDR